MKHNEKMENNFKDYGFEGNFEGEILKEYENHFIGMVYQNKGNYGCSWDKKGKCLQAKGFGYIDMDLKPIKKQEFTYPMWFKDRLNGHIVEFTQDRVGTVVYSPTGNLYKIGYYSENWASHINDEDYYWQQVENPNLATDKEIEQVINEEYENLHYKAQKIDTVARCKANMTLEQQKAICIFNIDRYLHREKGQNLSDIQKIKYYTNWLKEIESALSDS